MFDELIFFWLYIYKSKVIDTPIEFPKGYPKYVDWREKGAVTPVRDQKACSKLINILRFLYIYYLILICFATGLQNLV